MLESAHRFGGQTLKRIELLGSIVSVINQLEDMTTEGAPYTEKDWSPVYHASHPFPVLNGNRPVSDKRKQ